MRAPKYLAQPVSPELRSPLLQRGPAVATAPTRTERRAAGRTARRFIKHIAEMSKSRRSYIMRRRQAILAERRAAAAAAARAAIRESILAGTPAEETPTPAIITPN